MIRKIIKDYLEYKKEYRSNFNLFDKNLKTDFDITIYDKSGIIKTGKIKDLNIEEYIKKGCIIKVNGILKKLNYYEHLVSKLLDYSKKIFTKNVHNYIKENGFENIHKANPDISELSRFILSTRKAVSYFQASFMSSIAYHLFSKKDFFHSEMEPNIRLHLPLSYMTSEKKKYAEKLMSTGQATVHGPHIDSWYYHPYNTINIWAAIGKIEKHNGLWIMPNSIGHGFKYNSKKDIEKNEYINHDHVYSAELEPGDGIIFSSELYHSSAVNETDTSRLIISMRMTLDKPNFFNTDHYLYDYRKVVFKGEKPQIEKISKKLTKKQKEIIPEGLGTNDKKKVSLSELVAKRIDKKIYINKEKIVEGYALEIDKDCIVIYKSGVYYSFSKFCPHAGADLSNGGYIEDGKLICPWHLLSINLADGSSKCGNLKNYKTSIEGKYLVVDKI